MQHDKVAIVSNSAIALPPEVIREYNIRLVPPSFTMDGRTYRDGADISMDEIYDYLTQDKPFLTTPAPPHDYLEAYQEAAQWASAIVCLTVPRGISTMFDSARTAMEMAKESMPGVSIEVLDCGTMAGGQGFMVLAAAARAASGGSLEQVIDAVEKARSATGFFLLLKTVKYTARTGRLPGVVAGIGSLLNIKALITITGGRVKIVSAHRSMEEGIQQLIRATVEKAGNKAVTAIVMHSGYSEEVENFLARINNELSCTQVWLSQLSPITAYITGPGAMGIAFCPSGIL